MHETRHSLPASQRLIFALDVPTADEAKSLVRELSGVVSFFKVGLQLFVAAGPSLVRWLVERDLKVFLDLKIEDVPNTMREATREVARLGARFLTIHGIGASAQAAAEGSRGSQLQILCVTLLTSLSESDLRDQGIIHSRGRFASLDDYVVWRSGEAVKNGCQGLITSGQNVARLRQVLGPEPLLVCPGIRGSGDRSDDQKRVATPAEAIGAGADYLVVGRPIRTAADRLGKARQMIAEIESALAGWDP